MGGLVHIQGFGARMLLSQVFPLEVMICMQECALAGLSPPFWRQKRVEKCRHERKTRRVFGSKRRQKVGVRSDVSVFCGRPPEAATWQRRCERCVTLGKAAIQIFLFPPESNPGISDVFDLNSYYY